MMTDRVDLISFGKAPVSWALGEVSTTDLTPNAVDKLVNERLPRSTAAAWLFWDCSLGSPDPNAVRDAMQRPGDVWHAGLRLGMGGLPDLLDAISPNWMLTCDPEPNIEATSWRLSLRACLLKTGVLRQMGGIRPEFLTAEGAALEFGHRCVTRGVFTRHVPSLLPVGASMAAHHLPLEDALRFLLYRYGRFWSRWALLRAVLAAKVSRRASRAAWKSVAGSAIPPNPAPYAHEVPQPARSFSNARVTVLIPTVDRYPYLRTLLGQLRQQTIPALDIIVVDQTPKQHRDTQLAEEFSDLPLRVLYQDEPGQCASRNAGLQVAEGDYVLFLDDDDEIKPTLIEAHLGNLHRFRAEASSGVADEHGAGLLPEAFTYTRLSDVFPTNNTLVRRDALQRSGLFDLAYNRGQRADGDLGMRVYLSGALMVLNPEISVFHHHAPSGGLRVHKARVITYASSRHRLTHRQLVSATEIYLAHRYYSAGHAREMMWHSVLGTFSIRGGKGRKLLKALISFVCLPHSLWTLRQRRLQAMEMLQKFPQIPRLDTRSGDRESAASNFSNAT